MTRAMARSARRSTSVVFRSQSGRLLSRAVAVLLLVYLAECAAGSCLNYGHSCWGAHGKRSGGVSEPRSEELPDWYLSSLLRRINSFEASAYPSRKQAQIEDRNSINDIYRSLADTDGGGKVFESLTIPMGGEKVRQSRTDAIMTAKLMKMAKDATDGN